MNKPCIHGGKFKGSNWTRGLATGHACECMPRLWTFWSDRLEAEPWIVQWVGPRPAQLQASWFRWAGMVAQDLGHTTLLSSP